jgi:hypothetical protein
MVRSKMNMVTLNMAAAARQHSYHSKEGEGEDFVRERERKRTL